MTPGNTLALGRRRTRSAHSGRNDRHRSGKECGVRKKIALSALLLAVACVTAASAANFHTPTWNADYTCTYTNPPYPSVDGLSTWVLQSTQYVNNDPIYRTIEYYDASYGTENRKATFAKPVNTYYGTTVLFTTWEFTINPYGPQCKKTDVYGWGKTIYFNNCTDGHTRRCERLY